MRDVQSTPATDAARTQGAKQPAQTPLSSSAVAQSAELSGGLPYQAQMEAGFGQDFSGVQVQLGASLDAHHAHAQASRELVQFTETAPSRTQVAHELAHVVQFRRHGAAPAAARTDPDDPSEVEARRAADVVAGGGRFDVRAAPTAQVARDARTDFNAKTVAQQCNTALYDGKPADLVQALRPYRRDKIRLRAVRNETWSAYSKVLENACHGALSAEQYQQVYGWLRDALTLAERIEHEWYCLGVRGEGIMRIIEAASEAERVRCAQDATERDRFETVVGRLDVDVQFRARLAVYRPGEELIAVKARIKAAKGSWSNDYSAILNAVLRLSPAQRKQLMDEVDKGTLTGLSQYETDSLREMCAPKGAATTEQVALDGRMTAATTKLTGTDDAGVADLAQMTAERVAEERTLRAKAAKGGLTPAEKARLKALGYLDPTTLPDEQHAKALLYAKRGSDGMLDESCFLGKLRGDVQLHEWIAYSSTMGVEPFEICKQRMLEAKGEWLWDDEDAIFKAIDDLLATVNQRSPRPTSVSALRLRLWQDVHLNALLNRISENHVDAMQTHLQISGTLALHVKQIKSYWEGMRADYAGLLRELLSMSAEDRAAFLKHPYYEANMKPSEWTGAIGDAARAVLETGRLPTDEALKWAQGGWGDGTDEDVVTLALQTASEEKRRQYRVGYWLSREKKAPKTPAQTKALAVFEALEADLTGELSEADLHKALGEAIGAPRMSDFEDADGRTMAAQLLYHRQKEGVAMTEWAATNGFTHTDNNLAAAHLAFMSRYDAFMEDGAISSDELKVLGFLDNQFNAAAEDYAAASAIISEVASTIAAVAAGVILSLAVPGAGVMITAMIAGASKAVAAEAFAGRMSDLVGADGATNFAVGAVDGALAVAGAGIANAVTGMAGMSGKALRTAMINATVKGTETGAAVLKRRVAAGVVEGIVDGALSGMGNELLMTALDAEVWHQNMWQVMTSMGAALLRGGAMGAATGAVFGSVTQGVNHMVDARKMKSLKVQEVEGLGSTASVVYRKESDAIVDIQLHVGPNVSVPDIERHLEVVEALRDFSPLRQRLRRLLGKVKQYDEADRLRVEVIKHQGMIEDRLKTLAAGGLSGDQADTLVKEINTFRHAIDRFEERLPTAKGQAPEGKINSTEVTGQNGEWKGRSPKEIDAQISQIKSKYRDAIDSASTLKAKDEVRYSRYKEIKALKAEDPLSQDAWQELVDRLRESSRNGHKLQAQVLKKLGLESNDLAGNRVDFTHNDTTTRPDVVTVKAIIDVKGKSPNAKYRKQSNTSQLQAQSLMAKAEGKTHAVILASTDSNAVNDLPTFEPTKSLGESSLVCYFQDGGITHYWSKQSQSWERMQVPIEGLED